jgi:hypothetical protein
MDTCDLSANGKRYVTRSLKCPKWVNGETFVAIAALLQHNGTEERGMPLGCYKPFNTDKGRLMPKNSLQRPQRGTSRRSFLVPMQWTLIYKAEPSCIFPGIQGAAASYL